MAKSTVFTSNKSQAIRLPKPVAFPDDVRQVDVTMLGKSRLITPAGKRWDDLFAGGPRVSKEFLQERNQPVIEDRDDL